MCQIYYCEPILILTAQWNETAIDFVRSNENMTKVYGLSIHTYYIQPYIIFIQDLRKAVSDNMTRH